MNRWLCWLNGGHGYGKWHETGQEVPLPRVRVFDAEGNETPGTHREHGSECWRCGHVRTTWTYPPHLVVR